MLTVSCPCKDLEAWELLTHEFGSAHGRIDVIDGKHEDRCCLSARCAQKVEAGCISVVHLVAKLPHEVYVGLIGIERGELNPAGAQDTGDDSAAGSEPGDDHAVLALVDAVEGTRRLAAKKALTR